MSRKDYIAIAAMLRKAWDTESAEDAVAFLTYELSAYFKADNPNFDRSRFFDAACGDRELV